MSANPLNDISSVYMQEVFKPTLGKGGADSSGPKKVEKGKDDAESSVKRVRQAVYDIRYRARREDVKLDQAFSQYVGHTTMNAQEKSAVKEKLGLTAGASSAAPVREETNTEKYKVRVKDKESGKSYVRYANREKINQLRSNPNISSVEMTGYGDPYEGERSKGKQTAKVTSGKGLDPVGREDKDIDNDGDHDKSDKYLLNRRKVRGAAIGKKSVKEAFSDWRNDLSEVLDSPEEEKQIKEKKVNNKIIVNPELKESVESLGGFLVDVEELNCVLEEISDEQLYFLTDDLIEEVVEDVFYDLLDEGYDVDLIENILYESLDISSQLIDEKVDMVARASARKQFAAASEKSATEARKRGADVVNKEKRAEKIQKVKDTVKKVGSSIKSKIKSAAKSAVSGAASAVGKAVGTAKNIGSSVKSKASETAKKVSDTAKSGYESGKKSTESGESTATKTAVRAPKTYRYVRTQKKTGLSGKVGSLLKKGLKKAVGKTARFVAKGAEKVATRLGEAVTQMPGRETTPPAGTTSKQDDIQKKQMLANKQKMIQKQQQLQRQELQLQRQGKLPLGSTSEEVEHVDEGKEELKQRNKNEMQRKAGNLGREVVSTPNTKKNSAKRGAAMDRMSKLVTVIGRDDEKKRFERMPTREELSFSQFEVEEGMTLKDFKKKRSAVKQKEKRAEDKIAPTRRAGIHADKASPERAARHRANIDPDFEGNDERNYPGGKLNPKKVRKAKALGELGEARAEDKRGLEPTGENRKKQKVGVKTSSGQVVHPATSYSGGQNTHNRGKALTKTQRRASSRRYVDQPGGAYAAPENKQGEGRYAKMQAKKRDQSHMSSRFD
jgi:hypothetical protein